MAEMRPAVRATIAEFVGGAEEGIKPFADLGVDSIQLVLSYRSDIQETESSGGTIGINVGPATLQFTHEVGQVRHSDTNILATINIGRRIPSSEPALPPITDAPPERAEEPAP